MEVGQIVKVLYNSKVGPILSIRKDAKGKTIYLVKDYPKDEHYYYEEQLELVDGKEKI
jgi:hypothetical protein